MHIKSVPKVECKHLLVAGFTKHTRAARGSSSCRPPRRCLGPRLDESPEPAVIQRDEWVRKRQVAAGRQRRVGIVKTHAPASLEDSRRPLSIHDSAARTGEPTSRSWTCWICRSNSRQRTANRSKSMESAVLTDSVQQQRQHIRECESSVTLSVCSAAPLTQCALARSYPHPDSCSVLWTQVHEEDEGNNAETPIDPPTD